MSKFIDEWAVCGEASSGFEAVELVQQLSPDVVVLDVTLPDIDGLEVLRQVKRTRPETEVVMFSGHPNVEYIRQALDLGARSYILKTDSIVDLVKAVRAAAAHAHYYTPLVAGIVVSRFQPSLRSASAVRLEERLTDFDLKVVRFIAEGKRDEALARSLDVTVETAQEQCQAIMSRLGLKSASQLIRHAIRMGLVPAT